MIQEIYDQCLTLPLSEKRTDTEAYKEVVFFAKDVEQWTKALNVFFGPEKKKTGAAPAADDLEFTSSFGGIRNNQTLFRKDSSGSSVGGMFWPWQDGTHVTLKLFEIPKDNNVKKIVRNNILWPNKNSPSS